MCSALPSFDRGADGALPRRLQDARAGLEALPGGGFGRRGYSGRPTALTPFHGLAGALLNPGLHAHPDHRPFGLAEHAQRAERRPTRRCRDVERLSHSRIGAPGWFSRALSPLPPSYAGSSVPSSRGYFTASIAHGVISVAGASRFTNPKGQAPAAPRAAPAPGGMGGTTAEPPQISAPMISTGYGTAADHRRTPPHEPSHR